VLNGAVLDWILRYGYLGLFALLMFGIAGLPIPDETLLMFSGYLMSTGRLNPLLTFLVGFGGSVSGISLSYMLGRFVGQPVLLRYGRYIGLRAGDLDRVRAWYGRSGEWVLTVGYYIPAVRHFTALVAGMSRLSYRIFALFAYLGAAVWVATFLAIGYFVGENWKQALELIHRYTVAAVLLLVLVVAVALWLRNILRKRNSRSLS
jgi:membrane protein DedA with SNARE-associated domain